jgi:hypothetical protein
MTGVDMDEWIEIFRTGTHTDSAGQQKDYTQADLDKIVSQYDPSTHEAPVVIGHPVENAPAFGWVEALKREGEILYAKLKGLVPEFVDMVKKGLFKKRSMSIYPDLSLRHIGFLGAMPPAVKGLADIKFAAADAIIYEFAEISVASAGSSAAGEREKNKNGKGGVKMGLRDLLKGVFAKAIDEIPEAELTTSASSVQPRTFSEGELKTREEAAAKKGREEAAVEYAEKNKKDKAEAEAKLRKEQVHSFCEGLKKDGKLIPAWQKMGIETFMQELAGIPTARKFAEATEEKTPSAWFMDFLAGLPKVIEFREIATRDKVAETDFEKLVERARTEKKISRGEAISFVAKENPEAHKEYLDQINKKD